MLLAIVNLLRMNPIWIQTWTQKKQPKINRLSIFLCHGGARLRWRMCIACIFVLFHIATERAHDGTVTAISSSILLPMSTSEITSKAAQRSLSSLSTTIPTICIPSSCTISPRFVLSWPLKTQITTIHTNHTDHIQMTTESKIALPSNSYALHSDCTPQQFHLLLSIASKRKSRRSSDYKTI